MTDSHRIFHPVRVGYIDTDQGGIVHHATYLRWFEAARIEYLRERGIEYRAFEYDQHFALPVAKMELRYLRPARFDDALEVECWVGRLGRAMLRFDSRVWRQGEALSEAEITLACVRIPEMRVCSLPEILRRACSG